MPDPHYSYLIHTQFLPTIAIIESMRGVNKVILVGNATRDAELRHTQNGKPVSNLRLATNRSIRDEEETQFHTIVCWDRLAEKPAEYVKKGDPLNVEGRLQYRSFQDEEGKERGVAEIVADDVQFLSRRGNGNRGEPEA
jgi:single-strand DNA-binding protein